MRTGAQPRESVGDTIESDGTGEQRGDVEVTGRQVHKRLGELFGCVVQREPDVEFLEDALRRLEMVGAHVDAGDDDPRARRDAADQLLDEPGHTDAFEGDRRTKPKLTEHSGWGGHPGRVVGRGGGYQRLEG